MKNIINQIDEFVEKAGRMSPQLFQQNMELELFRGLLTEDLLSDITSAMSERGVLFEFGIHELNPDFSGFVPREGRIFIDAIMRGYNECNGKAFITWGWIDERWHHPSPSND